MVKVAGDGSKQILIGVLAQVHKRREVGWMVGVNVSDCFWSHELSWIITQKKLLLLLLLF